MHQQKSYLNKKYNFWKIISEPEPKIDSAGNKKQFVRVQCLKCGYEKDV
jgi:hypothetical protein